MISYQNLPPDVCLNFSKFASGFLPVWENKVIFGILDNSLIPKSQELSWLRKVAHPNAKKMHFPTWDLLVSKSAKNQVLAPGPGDLIKNHGNQWLLIKTKHLDCRPALNPLRILLGEILGRFWKENPSKILQNVNKSCKMLINLDLGRLRALKISSNRLRDLRDLRDLQKISGGKTVIPQSQIFSEKDSA